MVDFDTAIDMCSAADNLDRAFTTWFDKCSVGFSLPDLCSVSTVASYLCFISMVGSSSLPNSSSDKFGNDGSGLSVSNERSATDERFLDSSGLSKDAVSVASGVDVPAHRQSPYAAASRVK